MDKKLLIFINCSLALLLLFEPFMFIKFGAFVAYLISLFCLLAFIYEGKEIMKESEIARKKAKVLAEELEKSDEERIKLKDEKYKALIVMDTFEDGVIVLDKNDKVIFINSKAENLLEIQNEDPLKKTLAKIETFSKSKAIIQALLPNLKQNFSARINAKKDLPLDIFVSLIKFRESDKGSLIILREALGNQTDSSKTQLISLVSHQLKSPLASIKTALKMLLAGDFGALNKDQKEVLEKTYIKNDSLIILVNDLLNAGRVEDGQIISTKSPTNFEALVDSAVGAYKDAIAEKKIKFKFKKPEEKIPAINIDAEKIKIVIQNFIDNAIKYSAVGGEVTASLGKVDGNLRFKVKDSGIGIPLNERGKMFSEFFRGTNAIKTGKEGSGFGLFVSKKIIEGHKGKIGFDSKENQGSVFYFDLPF